MPDRDPDKFSIEGGEIRSVRGHWELTRGEFGREFGTSAATVANWERHGVTERTSKFNFALFGVLKLSQQLTGDNNEGTADKK